MDFKTGDSLFMDIIDLCVNHLSNLDCPFEIILPGDWSGLILDQLTQQEPILLLQQKFIGWNGLLQQNDPQNSNASTYWTLDYSYKFTIPDVKSKTNLVRV